MFANLRRCLRLCVRDIRAATAIEYALIVAGISMAIVAATHLLGHDLHELFSTILHGVLN